MKHLICLILLALTCRGEIVSEMLPTELLLPNAAALNLSIEQQNRLREGLPPLQSESLSLQRQLGVLNAELVRLIAMPKPVDELVLKKYSEVEAVESRIKVLRLKSTLLAKSVLSTEQQQQAKSLRGTIPSFASESMPLLREKLERVRNGIERMKAEGRDTTRVRELWDEFQKRADLRHYKLAMEALHGALALVEINNNGKP